jgi:hypothetical protein
LTATPGIIIDIDTATTMSNIATMRWTLIAMPPDCRDAPLDDYFDRHYYY